MTEGLADSKESGSGQLLVGELADGCGKRTRLVSRTVKVEEREHALWSSRSIVMFAKVAR